jgi:2,4-dienoyl-CoA reductase-like NADH-dependent reductase (Old Yellow Enzyme family)
MEYDKFTIPGYAPGEAKNFPHKSTPGSKDEGLLRYGGPEVDVSPLKETVTFPFSGRTAKNKFLKAPMTERLCHWNKPGEDISARGFPSEEYKRLYQRWGEGEIGVIVAGNLMLKYDAVEAFGNPILPDNHDGRVEAFKEVANLAKAHGSLFIAQLSHPGRQGGAALNPNPISASDVQLKIEWAGNKFNQPRAMTIPEIKDLVKHWGEVAYLCYQAGFDGVQIHCGMSIQTLINSIATLLTPLQPTATS